MGTYKGCETTQSLVKVSGSGEADLDGKTTHWTLMHAGNVARYCYHMSVPEDLGRARPSVNLSSLGNGLREVILTWDPPSGSGAAH